MRKNLFRAVMVLALGLGLGVVALAEGESPNSMQGKIGLFGNLGYDTYVMTDWNDAIDNNINHADFGSLHYRGDLSKITGGLTLGGGAQYGILDYLIVGAEVELLTAITSGTVSWTNSYYTSDHGSEKYDVSIPALAAGVFVKGALPLGERFLLTGGLGIESLMLNGKAKITDSTNSNPDQTIDYTGTGVGGKILVGGEYFFNHWFSLGVDAGYRMAKINKMHYKYENYNVEGDALKDDGSNMTVDYSGLILQGGVRFYF